MTFAFAWHKMIKNDTIGTRADIYWAEVVSGPSRHRSEVLLGLKYSSGQNVHCMLGAKVSVGPKWYWGNTGCEPIQKLT